MTDAIVVELELLWKAFITGLILIAIYGIFLLFRELHRHKKWLVVLEDILFWLFAAAVLFYLLYQENSGIVRGFFIAAAAAGMGCGYKILQKFLIKPLKKVIKRITIKRKAFHERRRGEKEKHGKQKKSKKKNSQKQSEKPQ